MKQLATFLLLFSFILTSCTGEDSEEVTPVSQITKDQVKGTWQEQSYRFDYYDSKGNKLHTIVYDNQFVEKIEVNDATLTWVWVEKGNAPSTVRYQLSIEKGKTYITLTGSDNKSDKAEVSELTNTAMVWQLKKQPATYPENGTVKTASYAITTITFSK